MSRRELHSPAALSSIDNFEEATLIDAGGNYDRDPREIDVDDARQPGSINASPQKRTYSAKIVVGAFLLGVVLATAVGACVLAISDPCGE